MNNEQPSRHSATTPCEPTCMECTRLMVQQRTINAIEAATKPLLETIVKLEARCDAAMDKRDKAMMQLGAVHETLQNGIKGSKVEQGDWADSTTLTLARKVLLDHQRVIEALTKEPAESDDAAPPLFYIWDKRNGGSVGNCASLWAKNAAGYVCHLPEAHAYTADEVIKRRWRDTDIPLLKSLVDKHTMTHFRVDMPAFFQIVEETQKAIAALKGLDAQ